MTFSHPIQGGIVTNELIAEKSSDRFFQYVLVADRLEAVKWRNWKLVFYEETRDWFGTPMKLTLPKLFNLSTDPKEEYPEETLRNVRTVPVEVKK